MQIVQRLVLKENCKNHHILSEKITHHLILDAQNSQEINYPFIDFQW
jgi:hypothetical protein